LWGGRAISPPYPTYYRVIARIGLVSEVVKGDATHHLLHRAPPR
jgi:hypothetical protein